jgi:hypothetical protein
MTRPSGGDARRGNPVPSPSWSSGCRRARWRAVQRRDALCAPCCARHCGTGVVTRAAITLPDIREYKCLCPCRPGPVAMLADHVGLAGRKRCPYPRARCRCAMLRGRVSLWAAIARPDISGYKCGVEACRGRVPRGGGPRLPRSSRYPGWIAWGATSRLAHVGRRTMRAPAKEPLYVRAAGAARRTSARTASGGVARRSPVGDGPDAVAHRGTPLSTQDARRRLRAAITLPGSRRRRLQVSPPPTRLPAASGRRGRESRRGFCLVRAC